LHGTKSIRERRREGWPARLSPGRSCKERKREEKRRRKFDEFGQNSFEF
jgi:hypothetical protein